MLDFTGFSWGYYLNDKITNLREQVFNFISIDSSTGVNTIGDMVNFSTDEQVTGFGILGFLVFIPSVIKGLFCLNKKYSIFAFIFVLNVLILSGSLAYMNYSIRFIASFGAVSSIVLALFYTKNKAALSVLIDSLSE